MEKRYRTVLGLFSKLRRKVTLFFHSSQRSDRRTPNQGLGRLEEKKNVPVRAMEGSGANFAFDCVKLESSQYIAFDKLGSKFKILRRKRVHQVWH